MLYTGMLLIGIWKDHMMLTEEPFHTVSKEQ